MKKVVIFIGTLSYGGAERVISILSKSLLEYVDNVEIILYYDKDICYEIDKRIVIKVIDKENIKSKNIFFKLLWFRKYIVKSNPDIVISFLAPFNIFSIISLLGTNIPVLVAERNDPRCVPMKKVMRLVRNLVYYFSDKIIVQTENNKKYFSKVLQKKCSVIYNPIFLDDEVGMALTTKKQKKIVTVGRLVPQKNQKLLIKAFSKIHEEYPEYKLVIYGEGSLREEFEKLIKELKLEKSVELPGNKSDIWKCISDAEVFVLTSEFEGMPNALLEAMCLGLPCISTKVSGAIDLVNNGENGILINQNDINELTNMIKKVISDKEFALHLGENASNLIDSINKEKIIKQWIDLII